jgi:hypothetical protein
MDTSNRERVKSPRRAASLEGARGLAAFGASGPWEVAIDETLTKAHKWYAQIEGRSIELYFEINSPDIVATAIRFLKRRRAPVGGRSIPQSRDKDDSLRLGTFAKAPVSLIWDDEYPDRCFLLVGPSKKACVRFSLTGEEIVQLTEALLQVKEDLGNAVPNGARARK